MIDYTALFCLSDDFLKHFQGWFEKSLLAFGTKKEKQSNETAYKRNYNDLNLVGCC